MLWNFGVLVVLLLGLSSGSPTNFDFDEINSHTNFANKLLEVLEKKDVGISAKCTNHLVAYRKGLLGSSQERKSWALKMFDASAKFPAGLLAGNIANLGFFDECLAVEGNTTLSTRSENIIGQYCIGTIPLVDIGVAKSQSQNQLPGTQNFDVVNPTPRVITPDFKIGIQLGICVPDGCSAAEIQKVFEAVGIGLLFYEELCQTKTTGPELDSGGIATISFLSVILWLMVVSTGYDAILQYFNKKPFHPICISFSVLTNGNKLITTKNAPGQISCLHGIRVISTMWVIISHRFSIQNILPARNFLEMQDWKKNEANMFILGATVSVDTFFVLSGLVVTYSYMCSLSRGPKFNIILYYVHRYLRLTPVLAVVIVLHITLFQYFGSGPIFPNTVQTMLSDGCKQNWWKALIYMQNYGNGENGCIAQSWYLSVDTQLFVLSPILLIPLKRWPKPTLLVIGFLAICSIISCFLTGWFFELNWHLLGNTDIQSFSGYMEWYYSATHTRASTWLIGLILGYYIFKIKQRQVKLVVNKAIILVVWVASLAVLAGCVYVGHSLIFEGDRLGNSFHMALVRPAWALALSSVIVLCVIGYGGPINWFLSLPVFEVLSKLTYTLYLVHYQVMLLISAQMRTAPLVTNATMMYAFWGDFALALVVSLILTLAFESPIITIEKVLFGAKTKKEVKEPVQATRYVTKSIEIA